MLEHVETSLVGVWLGIWRVGVWLWDLACGCLALGSGLSAFRLPDNQPVIN
jgi:hypothetical protein